MLLGNRPTGTPCCRLVWCPNAISLYPRKHRLQHCFTTASVSSAPYVWTGTDEFSELDDRHDKPPLPLPSINEPMRVVLVRHGQSTWNAEGRIQGSSNLAVLTAKGEAQALTTKQMLENDRFELLIHSPLERASKTAEIVWHDRDAPIVELPSLREIDLYSFQGLLKAEGKQRYGEGYKMWQRCAWDFEIDDHAPVRELWYRASMAWQNILNNEHDAASVLCVAHNAVNQALICTALGLPPTYFRRLLQSNAATTVLDFRPRNVDADGANGSTAATLHVTMDRLNQSPGRPFQPDGAGRAAKGRLVIVAHGATASTEDGIVLGHSDESCSALGELQSLKLAELLLDMEIEELWTSPLSRCVATAQQIAKLQPLAGRASPQATVHDDLVEIDYGEFEGYSSRFVRGLPWPGDGEAKETFYTRTKAVWDALLRAVDAAQGRSVVAVTHGGVHAALLCHCLSIDVSNLNKFRIDTGGLTIIEFPDGVNGGTGVVRCMNYTAHLGRWAVPITRDDLDTVCGVDGCF